MAITVKLPSDICTAANLQEVVVEAGTPAQAMKAIAQKHPTATRYLFNSQGQLRGSLAFFKNDQMIEAHENVPDGAILDVVAQISGG